LHTTISYRTFTLEEIQLLERIADQAAIALYNAQSYERLEELVERRTQELHQEKLLSEAANRAKSEFFEQHERTADTTDWNFGFYEYTSNKFLITKYQTKQYIEGISSCGKQLLELINDLLDLTKIEAGKEELILETALVEEVCQACLSLFRERTQQGSATVPHARA